MTDQNKPPQNLSPDLKQIYDRVMNTPAKGSAATPPPPNPAQPNTTPTPPAPITSEVPSAPKPASPTQNPPITPQSPVQTPEDSQPFLTSSAPRPLQGSVGVKSFSLGKDKKEESRTADPKGEKKGLSKTIIIILAAIFFVAWTFFWVVFFFNPFA